MNRSRPPISHPFNKPSDLVSPSDFVAHSLKTIGELALIWPRVRHDYAYAAVGTTLCAQPMYLHPNQWVFGDSKETVIKALLRWNDMKPTCRRLECKGLPKRSPFRHSWVIDDLHWEWDPWYGHSDIYAELGDEALRDPLTSREDAERILCEWVFDVWANKIAFGEVLPHRSEGQEVACYTREGVDELIAYHQKIQIDADKFVLSGEMAKFLGLYYNRRAVPWNCGPNVTGSGA